nr:hypothetical protein [Streptomyces sp. TLI_235]
MSVLAACPHVEVADEFLGYPVQRPFGYQGTHGLRAGIFQQIQY